MAKEVESPSKNRVPKRKLKWMVACLMAGGAQGLAAKTQEPSEPTRFTFTEYHMGIDARLVVYAKNSQVAATACEAAFKRIAELEGIMSDYRADSELMRLSSRAVQAPVPVSEDLFRVLQRAQIISKQTDGAFDVTIGPLVQLWRKARREAKLPSEEALASAKKLVGWKRLRLDADGRTAHLDTANMRLDLGGIAKGYASDEALIVLRKHGVTSALIEMGGDIVLGDAPPKVEGWKIDVPNARTAMVLKNSAISSSGDTEQYVDIDNVRYSHVIDPKTGIGLTHRVQATVIAKDGFTSDPLSTALTLVQGDSRTSLLSNYPGVRSFTKSVTP